MKQTSLEPHFLNPGAATGEVLRRMRENGARPTISDFRHALGELAFNNAYDLLRIMAQEYISRGDIEQAVAIIRDNDALLGRVGYQDGHSLNLHAAMMQILTALQIEMGDINNATTTAAATLTLLAQESKRRDEPFLAVLGSLLYDISGLHSANNEFKQAERELEKSLKIFERLARQNPERYGSAHVMAQNAVTVVYRNRVKQTELLAQYQAATDTYLDMMRGGVIDSVDRLIESLHSEGKTLVSMGRHREAIHYFSRALKYLTKLNPEMTPRQLVLSIDLGEALLNIPASRDKGIHLLNTMLHKATKINADAEHRRIVDILLNAKSRHLDILNIWHKLFPR